MDNKEQIGMRISELRKERGMTQEELAEASRVDRTNISKIESGVYNVSMDILSKIATVLECTVDITSFDEYSELYHTRRLNKAKAMFAYYEVESINVVVFGDWAVNECGDIINYKKNYQLYNNLLIPYKYDGEQALSHWHDHIAEKHDFDVEHFVEAFKYALPLAEKQKQVEKEVQ
ncbi:helix-turn-helix transcriptional regulator [Bacteroides sp.]|uniref:helix-turn-helix domain-containing protein n=1 Tax=Bacteroides sp. TaxID=29523 RepID=UPI0025B80ABC|nr:helix-turn-helix transcriptional regulator [Bacteroides sp.]